ncbi:hypothetical protein [Clostridium kluyveri]|uniref:Uncharacterized protein n=2 Tax=Clostridium kluyveri TaxID=1534 RepID=A5N2V5_CLOK5|nr:hypothetical protein [Clostridium kluyveri]EDK35451.1 Hypothetical protein CKL_3449 [Clostridium kluyveri DSM 555]BAH08101.1 hypothetical protein CKR_3050 [Clostridium kluyveri NBRC 12016]
MKWVKSIGNFKRWIEYYEEKKRALCTQVTNGIVTKVKNKGLDFSTIITVCYIVDSVTYQISESLKLKSKIIRWGIIPVGQKKYPVIPEISEGSTVRVNYNLANPAEAFITDNIGIINC